MTEELEPRRGDGKSRPRGEGLLSEGAEGEVWQTRVRPRSRKRVGMVAKQPTGVAEGDGLTYFPRSAGRQTTQKSPGIIRCQGFRRTAATYSPNWWVSTIGDGELNFSVRNGKRWILTAIATAI